MKTNKHLWSYLAQFFLKLKMFQTKVVEKIKTHILFPTIYFFNRVVYEIMWNNTVAVQATDNNMAYARFMLDT